MKAALVAGVGLAAAVSPPAIRALDDHQARLLAKGIRAQWREIPIAGQPSTFQVFYHPAGLQEQLVEKKVLQTLALAAEKSQTTEEAKCSTFVIPVHAQSLRGAIDEIMAKQPEELTMLEELVVQASKLSWNSVIQSEEKVASRQRELLDQAIANAKDSDLVAAKYLLWFSSPTDADMLGNPTAPKDWLEWIVSVQEADVLCSTSMSRFLRSITDSLQQNEQLLNQFANRIVTEYAIGYPDSQDIAEEVVRFAQQQGLELPAGQTLDEIVEISQGTDPAMTTCVMHLLEEEIKQALAGLEEQERQGEGHVQGHEEAAASSKTSGRIRQALIDDAHEELAAVLSILNPTTRQQTSPARRNFALTPTEQVVFFDVMSSLHEPKPEKWSPGPAPAFPALRVEELLKQYAGHELALLGLIQKEFLQLVPTTGSVLMQTHVASEPTIFASSEFVLTVPKLCELGFTEWKASGSESLQELAVRTELFHTVDELREVESMRQQLNEDFDELMQRREELRLELQRGQGKLSDKDVQALRQQQIDQTAGEIQIVTRANNLTSKRDAVIIRCVNAVAQFCSGVQTHQESGAHVALIGEMADQLYPGWQAELSVPSDLRNALESGDMPSGHPEDLIVSEANAGIVGRPLRDAVTVLDRSASAPRAEVKSWWSGWWFW